MGDKLLKFFQLIGRSCDHKFVPVDIKEIMSVMSSTVGIQLTSYTVGKWKTSLVGYAITITLWWYYKSVFTNPLITVGLMNFNPHT